MEKNAGPVFAAPPVLREEEDPADYFQGAAWTKGGFVHWVISIAGGTQYTVLRWNMYTGATQRMPATASRIRAIAYCSEDDALVLRKTDRLEYYSNRTLKLLHTRPFEKLQNYWKDMIILKNRVITIEPDSKELGIFDKETGSKQRTPACGKEQIQRLFSAGENRLWLWSSYWGTRFYLLDLETGWLPLESLGARIMAGMAANYHFIFTVNATLGNPFFDRYDRIAAYTGSNRWKKWEAAPLFVSWNRTIR